MRVRAAAPMSRRSLLRAAANWTALGSLFTLSKERASAQALSRPPNKFSAPSNLKITDIRGLTIASNYDYPIIRLDTNQGVHGLGEIFCNDILNQAFILKSHLVGRNPLEIENVLAGIRRFTTQGPSSGAYSAIDIALHDIAGKVYGVPVWRLLGNKLRSRLRLYCDTTGHSDPKIYGQRMLRRKQQGFTFFKMDLYTDLVEGKPGAVDENSVATERGLKHLCEIIQGVRDAIGWEMPLAADHFGRLTVNDAIRYARAFEPYHLAWAEDFISPKDWRGYKQITEATTTPTLTGEGLFGFEEGFQDLLENRAVDLIHPDVVNSGGLLECKRICDYAASQGIPAAIHMANSPVGQVASAHLCATLRNFVVLEFHAVDIPWWEDIVTGVSKPIVEKDGYQSVPDAPGLGLELNEDVVKKHLRHPGYFEPTTKFDEPMVGGHARGPYWHLDAEGKLVYGMDEHTATRPTSAPPPSPR